MQQSKPKQKSFYGSKTGIVRIIGGKWKGRRLKFTEAAGLRPTLDRVKETLFNWLMYDIDDARCLDLFSGSAALGIEALSRGALEVVFVEKNKKVSDNIKRNLKELGFDSNPVFNTSAEVVFKKNQKPYDIIFVDPPFYEDYLQSTLEQLNCPNFVKHTTLIYVEREKHGAMIEFPNEWEVLKTKQVGGLEFYLLRASQEIELNEES